MVRFNLLRKQTYRRCRSCGRTLSRDRVYVVPEHSSLVEPVCPPCADMCRRALQRSCIDALSVATQKGLLGLYGMGFLYCRREWAERMHPAYLARFGVDLGEAHEASMGEFDFRLRPAALRFDLGNYNFVAAVAANASIRYPQQWGSAAVEAYVLDLSHTLARGMLDLGLPVCGGAPGDHLAHIVSVGHLGSGGHDSTEDPRFAALHKYLLENRVRLSIRRGILRFSLHVHNTLRDVERVLDLV